MSTDPAPFRFLVLTQHWRQGHNRFVFPFAEAGRDAALVLAQRKADDVPGDNRILDQRLVDAERGVYSNGTALRSGADGRFLAPLPEAEQPEAAPVPVDNPILAQLGQVAAASRAADAG